MYSYTLKVWQVSHLIPWWACPSYVYGVTCCVVYWLTKYSLTPLLISICCHWWIEKVWDHFRRDSLSSFLLIDTRPSLIIIMCRYCNSEHINVFYWILQFSLDVNSLTLLGLVHILLPSMISLRTFVPRECFNGILYPMNCTSQHNAFISYGTCIVTCCQ